MRIAQPQTEEDFRARDRLLQAALRNDALPYEIAKEYPLVLNRESGQWSWCGFIGERIVAHVNLWPRECNGRRIGLVGNVATDAEFRGRGLMQKMFEATKNVAQEQGLTALVLWSDLQEFYQKLGFRSCGRERRYLFSRDRLKRYAIPSSLAPATPDCAGQLLPHRYPTAVTLARSIAEMNSQLGIPDTHTFRFTGGYAVEGRGADLRGVVHEWGAQSPEDLLGALHGIVSQRQLSQIMLLTPATLATEWDRACRSVASQMEEHPMALATGEDLDSLFVWGLDSI